jgi:hypothetical protein
MNNGWIKIHRKMLEWEWYDEPNTFRLFFHLLLKANHKPKKYRGVNIEAGQIMTGLDLLSKETGLSVQRLRTSLTRLKSTNEITSKTNSKGTIIQIVNYKKYQVSTSELTNEQQTSNKRATTNKNEKKEKNEEDVYIDIEILKDRYIKNERLIKAFSEAQKTNKDNIILKLEKFNIHLKSINRNVNNWNDYTSHFKNWFIKTKDIDNNNKPKLYL